MDVCIDEAGKNQLAAHVVHGVVLLHEAVDLFDRAVAQEDVVAGPAITANDGAAPEEEGGVHRPQRTMQVAGMRDGDREWKMEDGRWKT